MAVRRDGIRDTSEACCLKPMELASKEPAMSKLVRREPVRQLSSYYWPELGNLSWTSWQGRDRSERKAGPGAAE